MPKNDTAPSAVTRLAAHARDAAEVSDRWFVDLVCEIGGVGDWARSEAQAAAEALAAAVSRTIQASKKPAERAEAPNRRPGSAPEGATFRVIPELEEDTILISLLSGAAARSTNLDLLPASSGTAPAAAGDGERDAAPRASYPPGVLPVIDALERVVRDHAAAGGASLDQDARFWTLIELLQVLKRPQQSGDGEADNPVAPSAEER